MPRLLRIATRGATGDGILIRERYSLLDKRINAIRIECVQAVRVIAVDLLFHGN
jgi:hypothetical protein